MLLSSDNPKKMSYPQSFKTLMEQALTHWFEIQKKRKTATEIKKAMANYCYEQHRKARRAARENNSQVSVACGSSHISALTTYLLGLRV